MSPSDDKQTDDVSGAAVPARTPPTGTGRTVQDDTSHPHESRGPVDTLAEASDPDAFAPDATAPPPPQVDELARACVRFVARRYGASQPAPTLEQAMLDFRPETLSFLDQWVRDARTDAAAAPGKAEAFDLAQAAVGAYFGEVVRRWFGGRWIAEGEHATWRLCLSSVFCAFNPLGMAREALLLAPADGWGAHLELDPADRAPIGARLEALPAASDDEYYAPTTRFDVLCIVVDALRTSLRARGLGDVRFTPDDYASARSPAR